MLLNSSNEENNNIPVYLEFYIKHIKPKWKSPEWGFPKGRRDKRSEENMVCACREFEEETGYKKSDYSVLNKIEPIEEKLTGTNGVNYKHIYYLAINNCDINSDLTDYDTYEIGEIKWFTYDEAMTRIRPYHIEKKEFLQEFIFLFSIILFTMLITHNYYCQNRILSYINDNILSCFYCYYYNNNFVRIIFKTIIFWYVYNQRKYTVQS